MEGCLLLYLCNIDTDVVDTLIYYIVYVLAISTGFLDIFISIDLTILLYLTFNYGIHIYFNYNTY